MQPPGRADLGYQRQSQAMGREWLGAQAQGGGTGRVGRWESLEFKRQGHAERSLAVFLAAVCTARNSMFGQESLESLLMLLLLPNPLLRYRNLRRRGGPGAGVRRSESATSATRAACDDGFHGVAPLGVIAWASTATRAHQARGR